MATLAEVSKVLAGAMPLYPNFKRPEGDERDFYFKTWLRYVGHLEPAILQSAMEKAVINHPDFFPTPGHVLECVGQIASGAGKTGMEAWAELQAAISEHGFYDPPNGGAVSDVQNWIATRHWTFSNLAISQLVTALGGWAVLCHSENPTADRAHFVKAYEAIQARNAAQAGLPEPPQHQPATIVAPRPGVEEMLKAATMALTKKGS